MQKRINLSKENVIIFNKNPGYCCDTISIDNGYLKKGELIKSLGLYIWDDICFKAYSKNRNINYIDFDIDINNPIYFCVKHLLGEDNELIIDDDDTYGRLNKYLVIKKVDDIYKFIFINNLEKNDYELEKFRVFIKNIGPDCRSKIIDFSIKKRIVYFFRELENILLEDYHQITFEEYLEFNKVKKRIKSR